MLHSTSQKMQVELIIHYMHDWQRKIVEYDTLVWNIHMLLPTWNDRTSSIVIDQRTYGSLPTKGQAEKSQMPLTRCWKDLPSQMWKPDKEKQMFSTSKNTFKNTPIVFSEPHWSTESVAAPRRIVTHLVDFSGSAVFKGTLMSVSSSSGTFSNGADCKSFFTVWVPCCFFTSSPSTRATSRSPPHFSNDRAKS